MLLIFSQEEGGGSPVVDLVINPTLTIAQTGASRARGNAGETIVAGKAVFLNTATSKWMLSDADGVAAVRKVDGISLNGASNGQPIDVLTSGPVVVGGTLVPGQAYWLSGTPGGITTRDQLSAGMDPILIGVASSATVLSVGINDSGVTL